MPALDRPVLLRVDLTSPSLGVPVMLHEQPLPDGPVRPAVVTLDLLLVHIDALHADVRALRDDLAARTWSAWWERLCIRVGWWFS